MHRPPLRQHHRQRKPQVQCGPRVHGFRRRTSTRLARNRISRSNWSSGPGLRSRCRRISPGESALVVRHRLRPGSGRTISPSISLPYRLKMRRAATRSCEISTSMTSISSSPRTKDLPRRASVPRGGRSLLDRAPCRAWVRQHQLSAGCGPEPSPARSRPALNAGRLLVFRFRQWRSPYHGGSPACSKPARLRLRRRRRHSRVTRNADRGSARHSSLRRQGLLPDWPLA
jgi:hypothetical protein